MTTVEIADPKWFVGVKEREKFFGLAWRKYESALDEACPTYDTYDEVDLPNYQLFPDPKSPISQKLGDKKLKEAALELNQKADEWDKLHPNDKCKRVAVQV